MSRDAKASKPYRPNVAAILRKGSSILIGERYGVKQAWQFPQGGMDAGESAEEALFREVQEEVGISRVNLRMVEKRGPYRYRYPLAHRKSQKWEGQEQTYFLCDFLGQDRDFCLDSHGEQEFSSVRWIDPQQFSRSWLPDFKVEVYEQVFRDFFGAELRS